MTNCRIAFSTVLLVVVFVAPLLAHHSIAGGYELGKRVRMRGVITNVEWKNPHSFISMNVKDPNGKITSWTVEMAAAGQLTKAGLDKKSIDLTQSYSVEGFPAKDGSTRVWGLTLTFANGITFDVGDSFFLPPSSTK